MIPLTCKISCYTQASFGWVASVVDEETKRNGASWSARDYGGHVGVCVRACVHVRAMSVCLRVRKHSSCCQASHVGLKTLAGLGLKASWEPGRTTPGWQACCASSARTTTRSRRCCARCGWLRAWSTWARACSSWLPTTLKASWSPVRSKFL